eukprot:SAG31_NODE_3454_length_4253_cov_2.613866_2_plen_196_part_00
MANLGVTQFLDEGLTAAAKARIDEASSGASGEPAPDDGLVNWLWNGVSSLLGGDEQSTAEAAQAAEQTTQGSTGALTVDGRALTFQNAAFGPTEANIEDVLAVRADPLTVGDPSTNQPVAPKNRAQLAGRIAIVARGDISFVEKARAVQEAGAVAMVCANTEDDLGKLVGAGDDINIPCVCIKVRALTESAAVVV